MSEDAGCADRFLCVPLATVTKPISDLRLLISGLFPLPFALSLVSAMLFALCLPVSAQQAGKVYRVGRLSGSLSSSTFSLDALRRELRELGYVEGKNIAFELRYAEEKPERLSALADELVRLKVDLIIAGGPNDGLTAKKATKMIPIVFTDSPADPVALGLVDSLARPGGNVTGFYSMADVLAGKRLQVLKESIPKLSRVAVLRYSKSGTNEPQWTESQLAARQLGLQLYSMEIGNTDKYESAFKEAIKSGSAGLAVTRHRLSQSNVNQKRIVELAKYRLPAIYFREDFVEQGGLMSYGADEVEPFKRVAAMIDKILKGAKPADIPVEQSTKFEFVINLKAAKRIGLTIPPDVLARANRIIK
jgi:putative tryptophan/tyrosine transport system substrate-binding protein